MEVNDAAGKVINRSLQGCHGVLELSLARAVPLELLVILSS
jgi:hypothetical protein